MDIISNILNPLTLPINDINLIEASAGTGKTYILSIIYLRLLLGIHSNIKCFKTPLSIKQILVITFTKNATIELRKRIKDNICKLKLACLVGKSNDILISSILKEIKCFKQAIINLSLAEKQINEASIFTIHSFCYRTLNYYSTDINFLLKKKYILDESILYKKIIIYFWKKNILSLPKEIILIIKNYWNTYKNFIKELLPYLNNTYIYFNTYNINQSIKQRHKKIINIINQIKKKWISEIHTIMLVSINYAINCRVYNKKNILFWCDKINEWSYQYTNDYSIPKELYRFQSQNFDIKNIQNKTFHHNIFYDIDIFLKKKLSLKELIFVKAIENINKKIKKIKKIKLILGFNDLLDYFNQILSSNQGKNLASKIRNYYPIAMIDEFQDTDYKQYKIFNYIYRGYNNCSLLLIGDPKQAIYSFRGADIFNYLRIRKTLNNYYTLNINWRSSSSMVNAVNNLFKFKNNPFLLKDINFIPINTTSYNKTLNFVFKKKVRSALNICLQPGIGVNIEEYKNFMVSNCVNNIKKILESSINQETWLEKNKKKEIIKASDIAILVRNKNEASLIRKYLSIFKIPSFYSSCIGNIFETIEANELFWILEAILQPEKKYILRALSTSLLGLNSETINLLNHNIKKLNIIVKEFMYYNKQWKKNNISLILDYLIANFNIESKILNDDENKQKIINLIHLKEILQNVSLELKSRYALMHWLSKQIQFPDKKNYNYKIKLENNQNLIQIVNLHKSKGLEFPLVFLPFISNFHLQKKPIFHNRQTYNMHFDINASYKSLKLAEEERLSEDLRLLYVAITRAIYYCEISVAPIFYKKRKKIGITDFHYSSIGYLIQQGRAGDYIYLYQKLLLLIRRSQNHISLNQEFI